jgi:hypothetical protein
MLNLISFDHAVLTKLGSWLFWLAIFVATLATGQKANAQVSCASEITANVVVFDNPTVFNRLGAQNPNWIVYALERDAINRTTRVPCSEAGANCQAGNVELRPDKRPRPLVVRSVAGACLTVNFTNLLAPMANPNNAQQDQLFNDDQVAGRCAGFHASGTELRNIIPFGSTSAMANDGSMVGANPGASTANTTGGVIDPATGLPDPNQPLAADCGSGGLAAPGQTVTYNLYTPHEGAYVINSYGAVLGSEQSSGNLGMGMFGALNVQPAGASMYRSQVTEEELRLATVGTTPLGQPIIDYEATYPNSQPWISEGKANLKVLNMITNGVLQHSDINAIIVGSNGDGTFPGSTYPLESVGKVNPQLPNRLEPFREFTSIFHDEQTNSQVFPRWYNDPVLSHTLAGVRDSFMINYGSGGIGSEIIASRLHTGPMHDCTDCAYEEFFLASQTVGDPGGLVNFPANTGIEQCDPKNILSPACWRQFNDANPNDPNDPANVNGGNPIVANPPIPGNFALYQEDPSNVHHSYTGDFVKIRNIHAGAFEQHIFHLHNHQWLFNPNDDNANYLDAQEIMPGSGHTYELVNGGAGNRNKTAGDAIFHCHFYPHFAQGMWYHIRIQDMFEKGTLLAVSTFDGDHLGNNDGDADGFHDQPFALRSGQPAAGARALPDAELPDGWPIPAIVPLPGKAMPHMPAGVAVMAVDRGDFGVASGRRPPNDLGQGPDSSQAVITNWSEVAGPDGELGTADDVSPGFPFWLAGNTCGVGGDIATGACPEGTVGQRMMTPVLDMLTVAGANANGYAPGQAGGWDGGLPRHNLRGYTSGGLSLDTQNRLDFRKVVEMAAPVYYPEIGTALEQVSMAYQAVRDRASFANNLGDNLTTPATWVMNGSDPVPGGPFQDPCVDDDGDYLGPGVVGDWFDGDGNSTLDTRGGSAFNGDTPRTYKIANVQIDAVFNKVGHHYSQERIIALWEDVAPTFAKQRPPEPLVMRFNTFDCGKLLHSNLVPAEYELDDFQVRTPTDIIGQHIHLPKWDLTTDDGAANGWNYEDGTLSPGMVDERIHAINNYNALTQAQIDGVVLPGAAGVMPTLPEVLGLLGINVNPILANAVANHVVDLTGLAPVPTIDTGDPGSGVGPGEVALHALPHPFFGAGVDDEYLGARTTIQRILVDPVVNVAGVDRGLGLTFSHDHYGPSTFQQIGLYSTILAEPAGSTWVHNESGIPLGTRDDGGPTTWQAAILPPASAPNGSNVGSEDLEDHREFYFEMSDFQHAYNAGVYVGAGPDGRPILTQIDQPDPFDATVAFAPALEDTWQDTVNPTLKLEAAGGFPAVVTAKGACPGVDGAGNPTNFDPNVPRPCAEAINIGHSSVWVINYRNEPVGYRVFDPNAVGPDGQNGAQTEGPAGDLALAFASRTDRAIPQLNTSFGDTPYPTGNAVPYCQGNNGDFINCDRKTGDPFTPIMRAYERDQVKIKIQVGATEEQHQATVHGIKWLSNGSGFGRSGNSGWRNFQSHGISEQFSLQVPMNPALQQAGQTVDYLYATDATRPGIWLGTWGILRSYGNRQQDLFELPDNDIGGNLNFVNRNDFDGVCPSDALVREFDITAVLANDVLGKPATVTIPSNAPVNGLNDNAGGTLDPNGGTLVYNRRTTNVPDVTVGEGAELATFAGGDGPLHDPTAMMYVRSEELIPLVEATAPEDCFNTNGKNAGQFNPFRNGCDVNITGCESSPGTYDPKMPTCPVRLRDNVPVEPLVLRANAGDCIEVTLRNRLVNDQATTQDGKLVYESGGAPAWAPYRNGDDPGYVDENGAYVAKADIVWDKTPDLAGWQDMMWGVTRRIEGVGVNAEMYFFNNNLVRPGAYAGIHPQVVSYDASRDDGMMVGRNQGQTAEPGKTTKYRYYAGDLFYEPAAGPKNRRNIRIVATPIEYGATNLLSADRIKQPQKGLFGALVIEPAGATFPDALFDEVNPANVLEDVPDGQGTGAMTRKTRAQVTVTSPIGDAGSGGTYREALAIGHKIANLRWADGRAIKNLHQGELGREGAEDSGHAGFNYGMEPSWFRFALPPDVPFGNAGAANSFGSIPNVQAMYANDLVAGGNNAIPDIPGVAKAGDPATPVFRAPADTGHTNPVWDTRMHVLNGASADRDGTFILHGHLWQRDPYVCTGLSQDASVPLAGRCDPDEIAPSQALGLNPQGKYMGGEEGMGHVFGYWPILFDAGGTDAVQGDYLFRDYSPSGNRNGQFGILRAE